MNTLEQLEAELEEMGGEWQGINEARSEENNE